MNTNTSRKLSNKKITGQGMSEYLIIVGLLAVAGIATMGFMGNSLRNTFGAFAETMAGDTASAQTAQDNAQTDSQGAVDNARVSLGNYDDRAQTFEDTIN